MKKKPFLPVFLFLPALLLVNGCSSTKQTSAPAPAQVQNPAASQQNLQTSPVQSAQPQSNAQANVMMVTIQNFVFSPASLTIKKGDTVTWTNQDSAPHQIASDTNVFNGPAISKGQTYSFTFKDTGTFAYHCAIHPMMKGTITVQ